MYRLTRKLAVFLGVILFASLPTSGTEAAPSACPLHFLGGTAPDIGNPRMREKAREICFSEYALLHSGLTRTPIYTAERLTRHRVQEARSNPREDSFHEDATGRIPASERSTLRDYQRSGFDRGHVAPNGNMSTDEAQRESFTLANMIPQNPDNNRNLWRGIETAVRNMASRHGEVWVVTGPMFMGERIAFLNGRVAIPTHVFKAVWVPSLNAGAVYVAPNAPGGAWETASISQVAQATGIDLFPALPAEAKASSMELPSPNSPRGRAGPSSPQARAPQAPAPPDLAAVAAGWVARHFSR